VLGEECAEILLTGLLENGEITAIDDLQTARARLAHQKTELAIELRRAPRDVQRRHPGGIQVAHHQDGHLRGHLLPTLRTGVYVTVHAALVAAVTDIDLQGVETATVERWKIALDEQRQRIAHDSVPEDQRACYPPL
jgi:hypothetical protein